MGNQEEEKGANKENENETPDFLSEMVDFAATKIVDLNETISNYKEDNLEENEKISARKIKKLKKEIFQLRSKIKYIYDQNSILREEKNDFELDIKEYRANNIKLRFENTLLQSKVKFLYIFLSILISANAGIFVY